MKTIVLIVFPILILSTLLDVTKGNAIHSSESIQTRACANQGEKCCTRAGCTACCGGYNCKDTSATGYNGKCVNKVSKCDNLLLNGKICDERNPEECCTGNCQQNTCGHGTFTCVGKGVKCYQPAKNCKGIGGDCKGFADCCQPTSDTTIACRSGKCKKFG